MITHITIPFFVTIVSAALTITGIYLFAKALITRRK